ncbi:hypothetical protein CcCBS67573_g04828 [Chytriomyces confervae]|uniref:SKP1 component dimerisation domain-containing protein n=1 Tax=Chytriomyces confervae TaxID=246404 RepID=A0A507FDT3_9FUNG|nr:hypothetical protein CcCBS67573_g04828 [Chytriomyces confervae]
MQLHWLRLTHPGAVPPVTGPSPKSAKLIEDVWLSIKASKQHSRARYTVSQLGPSKANYLPGYEDAGCRNMIKGKHVEEVRSFFNVVDDFTPEEEEQIRKEARQESLVNTNDAK